MSDVRYFIEEKQRLQEQGFEPISIIEMAYFEELRDKYIEKVLKFEERLEDVITNTPDKMNTFLKHSLAKKKTTGDSAGWKIIHAATSNGFSAEEIAHLGEVESTEGDGGRKRTFMTAFETIVGNSKMVPDKSCILLYTHEWRKALSKRITVSKKVTERAALSKRKGQKTIVEYFKTVKSVTSPCKKPEKIPKYRVEKLVQELRGDTVKILWIPSGHYDLDPSQYVSVILRNEIALRVDSKSDPDLRSSCEEALSRLPNGVWTQAFKFVEDAIDFYQNGGNKVKDEAGPSGLTREDFDAAVAAFELQAAGHASTDNETGDTEDFDNVEVKVEIEERDLE